MGKIEDVDQLKPQQNGDTHHNENELSPQQEDTAASVVATPAAETPATEEKPAAATESTTEVKVEELTEKVNEIKLEDKPVEKEAELKEMPAPAAAPTAVAEPTPVEQTPVEPTPAVEPTPEPVVSAPAPVEEAKEIKDSEPVVGKIEETKVEEPVAAPPAEPVAPVVEAPKEEAAKVEVKDDKTIVVVEQQPTQQDEPKSTELVDEKKIENGDSTIPPPLPTIPPPSQVTVFAETAMASSTPEIVETSIPVPCDFIVVDEPAASVENVESQTESIIVQSNDEPIVVEPETALLPPPSVEEPVAQIKTESNVESTPVPPAPIEETPVVEQKVDENPIELIPDTVAEVPCETVLTHIQESQSPQIEDDNKSNEISISSEGDVVNEEAILEQQAKKANTENTVTESTTEVAEKPVVENESDEPKPEQIAATIALIEKVTEGVCTDDLNNSSGDDTLPPPPPPAQNPNDEETKDNSVDISSPLPQNSLDSLPSPSLSQSDVSLPPPPTDNDIAAAQNSESNSATKTQEFLEQNNESAAHVVVDKPTESIKTNGDLAHDEEQQHIISSVTDKIEVAAAVENSVNETSATESQNGGLESAKIEEVVPVKCPAPVDVSEPAAAAPPEPTPQKSEAVTAE
jgi:hypothetical protein